ncbi:MAG: neutral/alkaline non-lysosomal ceramidase N-terminal domain-containing protein [Verrucomicrobiae bacterium]|nr:neutral/alkaline non-lysosomal ceramidase N-terminal domain-containing protein [Verrucomicrobiae bacterium]
MACAAAKVTRMKPWCLHSVALFVAGLLIAGCAGFSPDPGLIPAGVARVDISPTAPVRLMGYAARAQLPAPTNILQRIHARALALGAGSQATVLLTVDNCILPGAVTEEIRNRLSRRLHLPPERLAITVTHTHSAPCLTGAAPNIFAQPMSDEDLAAIAAYTRFFTDRLEEAAVTALQRREPARLAWGQGRVTFAKNRRSATGPVDHDLPLLRVTAPDGRLRAVLVSYACHCTTLSGATNATHGDWAGSAAAELEETLPDTVALVAIGCGADANPDPRGTLELAAEHGASVAREARRLLSLPLTPLTQPPVCRLRTILLPYQPHFTRDQWQRRATQPNIVGYHARKWLERLDRGEAPSESLPYPVQTWAFGDQLAMVFLGGEVVVDYSLRLKRELDPSRVWLNAYANDVPCYIPSRRILSEGGYEAESSLWYYDRPQQLSPDIEDLIVGTVLDLLPPIYRNEER